MGLKKTQHPKFIINKAKNGRQYYFSLTAKNGMTILSSKMYNEKKTCKKAIERVRGIAPDAQVDFTG